jgi:hypothetical protein
MSIFAPAPTMCCPMRVITLAFLRPRPDDKDWVNRLVARVSRYGISHCELVFEDNMAFSIFAGEPLFFKYRTFSNPDYELVSLYVSHVEYASAYAFCQQAVDYNIGFTDVGMVACYFQPKRCPCINTGSSLYVGHTFCSKIVTEALQFACIPEVQHLVPCTTTPSCLYDAVSDSNRKAVCSVPYKRDRLQQVGVWLGGKSQQ